MVNGDTKQHVAPEADSDLAKDVANLYSWANVEGAPYRDFSRQKKIRLAHHANDVDIRKSDPLPGAETITESREQVVEAANESGALRKPLPIRLRLQFP